MSFIDKADTSNEEVDALVDSLHKIEGTSLSEANLGSLEPSHLQELQELSQDLHSSDEMETEESEILIEEVEEEPQDSSMEVEEEIVASEVEISTETDAERSASPEEILPDVKTTTKAVVPPPLRPLTIAPKPQPTKVPISAIKSGGQQLILLQGASGTQTIKLLNPQGQQLNLSNLNYQKPVTLKPATKTITGGNIQMVTQKGQQIIMKKFVNTTGQKTYAAARPAGTAQGSRPQFMIVQKGEKTMQNVTPQIKFVQTQLNAPTKTITLQQAQEMGLIAGTPKIVSGGAKQHLIMNSKGQKTIKLLPQQVISTAGGGAKAVTINPSPTKLPTRLIPTTGPRGQVVYKRTVTSQGQSILPQGQLIQVEGGSGLNTGQLHQINIPGKGVQYIKFVPAATASGSSTVSVPKPIMSTIKTSTASSSSNLVLTEIKNPISLSPTKQLKPIVPASGQLVMLPNFSQKRSISPAPKVAIPKAHAAPRPPPTNHTPEPRLATPAETLDANGIRPRKPCNCNKSQCLKLYCDCFANGEFCHNCNCINCFNNLEKEEFRQRAIKSCLERNPSAFRPKIGKAKDLGGDLSIRKHTKGCNCKRSWCLKNYCECYEAKIACSSNCKCVGCRNIEDCMERKDYESGNLTIVPIEKIIPKGNLLRNRNSTRQAINFITDEVIEATSQCLLTIAEHGIDNMQNDETTIKEIIQEFGRCLNEIIECSSSRN